MKINPIIIISRTDNIGDVVLTLPLAIYLKQQWPQSRIIFLARDYVAAVVIACPAVDQFMSWEQLKRSPHKQAVLALRGEKADIILHVAPNKIIAQLAKLADIPIRIGTNRRWYHWLTCNKLVNFTRKNSPLHEAQLNFKLLKPLKLKTDFLLDEIAQLQNITCATDVNEKIKKILDKKRFNLVIHALTNGNTHEWSMEHFVRLVQLLPQEKFNIIITGTAKEKTKLKPLLHAELHVQDAVGEFTLDEFINLLSQVNGIVVGSTGPLHIAAALGIHCLGLYPAEPGKSPKRWAPIGKQAQYLVAEDIQTITPEQVAAIVQTW
jgi:ADP-heptose:LPS heptosyltransferase